MNRQIPCGLFASKLQAKLPTPTTTPRIVRERFWVVGRRTVQRWRLESCRLPRPHLQQSSSPHLRDYSGERCAVLLAHCNSSKRRLSADPSCHLLITDELPSQDCMILVLLRLGARRKIHSTLPFPSGYMYTPPRVCLLSAALRHRRHRRHGTPRGFTPKRS
ncbi:hypothetical protein BDW71DRAFT_98648 [Aspergillus fruticulosus]